MAKREQILLLQFVLSAAVLIIVATSLPITSKPIENTPEHLAWEAWIMVPPAAVQERSRKITPKSIFITPNKTTKCPPGHRLENNKCIPIVTVDHDQILIDLLNNLVHSTSEDNKNGTSPSPVSNDNNYEYDYEYDDVYDMEGSQPISFNQQPLLQTNNNNHNNKNINNSNNTNTSNDYNEEEPLKINLGLDNFPLINTDVKSNGSRDVFVYDTQEESSTIAEKYDSPTTTQKQQNQQHQQQQQQVSNFDELTIQPFRDEKTSTANTGTTTTISNFNSIATTNPPVTSAEQTDIAASTAGGENSKRGEDSEEWSSSTLIPNILDHETDTESSNDTFSLPPFNYSTIIAPTTINPLNSDVSTDETTLSGSTISIEDNTELPIANTDEISLYDETTSQLTSSNGNNYNDDSEIDIVTEVTENSNKSNIIGDPYLPSKDVVVVVFQWPFHT